MNGDSKYQTNSKKQCPSSFQSFLFTSVQRWQFYSNFKSYNKNETGCSFQENVPLMNWKTITNHTDPKPNKLQRVCIN